MMTSESGTPKSQSRTGMIFLHRCLCPINGWMEAKFP